jgi:hypothetical protein
MTHRIPFVESTDLLFHRDRMFPPGAVTHHPNGVRFTALDAYGNPIWTSRRVTPSPTPFTVLRSYWPSPTSIPLPSLRLCSPMSAPV